MTDLGLTMMHGVVGLLHGGSHRQGGGAGGVSTRVRVFQLPPEACRRTD